jgi:hypothetical protein
VDGLKEAVPVSWWFAACAGAGSARSRLATRATTNVSGRMLVDTMFSRRLGEPMKSRAPAGFTTRASAVNEPAADANQPSYVTHVLHGTDRSR